MPLAEGDCLPYLSTQPSLKHHPWPVGQGQAAGVEHP